MELCEAAGRPPAANDREVNDLELANENDSFAAVAVDNSDENDSFAAVAVDNNINDSSTRSTGLKGIVKGATSAVKMSRGKSMEQEVDDFHPQDDIYSLLFSTPFSIFDVTSSIDFLFSLSVPCHVLILADLLEDGTEGNWLAIPHGVGTLVSVSQVFALFITGRSGKAGGCFSLRKYILTFSLTACC